METDIVRVLMYFFGVWFLYQILQFIIKLTGTVIVVRAGLEQMRNAQKDQMPKQLKVSIEEIHGHLYVWNVLTGEFVCQGATKEAVIEALLMTKRFHNTVLEVVKSDENTMKKSEFN